ncbi:MAG TPA: response regulator [Chitinophagaceae bacterium]|nr:response regulator [Chitinophagaceae bacterium]
MREINTILLVDDDKDDQYFFYKALEEADPSVTLLAAGNGADALEKLKFARPDIILLDLVMPVMNGVAFLRKVKADKQLRDIPVIVYTSDLSIFKEKEVLALGAEKIIYKPLDFEGTVRIIRNLAAFFHLKQSA